MQSDSATDEDAREEQRLRDQGRIAFHEGRFADAFSLLHASLLSQALRWFREEGVTFTRPPGSITPTDLLVGLAIAANGELEARGDAASDRFSSAAWLFQAVAELRLGLDEHVPLKTEAVSHKIAELTLRGFMLGQIDMIMNAIRLGWLDKLAEHEIDRARRSAGAAATNAKKATLQQEALGSAIRIVSTNPTLSHEEVAVKVRESLGLSTTVKTLTGWVRDWRRKGFLPDRKRT